MQHASHRILLQHQPQRMLLQRRARNLLGQHRCRSGWLAACGRGLHGPGLHDAHDGAGQLPRSRELGFLSDRVSAGGAVVTEVGQVLVRDLEEGCGPGRVYGTSGGGYVDVGGWDEVRN